MRVDSRSGPKGSANENAVNPGRKASDRKVVERAAKGGARQKSQEPHYENANTAGTRR